MNAYLLSVIGSVLIAAIFTAILPTGKTAVMVKGITKMVCLLAIVAPIPGFLKNADSDTYRENSQIFFSDSVIATDTTFIKYYSEMRIHEVEQMLEEELLDEFGVAANVKLSWEYITHENEEQSDAICIKQMHIATQTTVSEQVKTNVRKYLVQNYCNEVSIE